MSDDKTVVKRQVEVQVDIEPALYAYSDRDVDLQEGETLNAYIARQRADGETPYTAARELDLLADDITLSLAVVEHYSDGTKKTVDRVTWSEP